ncbi:MAG: hypothetical protein ACRD2W_09925, partial [Acidimicrobiales bacterium]
TMNGGSYNASFEINEPPAAACNPRLAPEEYPKPATVAPASTMRAFEFLDLALDGVRRGVVAVASTAPGRSCRYAVAS